MKTQLFYSIKSMKYNFEVDFRNQFAVAQLKRKQSIGLIQTQGLGFI